MSELYDLPDGWEWKELKSFGKFIRGVSYKKDQLLETKTDNSLILLRANNIQNELNLDEVQIIPKDVAKGKEIKNGDILFAMSSGSKHLVGKNILLNGLDNYTFGAFCSIYRNEDKSNLDNNYLSYILKSDLYRNKLSELSIGANINNLKSKDLEIMKIPIAPIFEQQRIVSKLDNLFEKIDKAIELHQKNIYEANVFMGSVLNDVFGELEEKYEKKSIGSFSKVGTGVTPLKSRDDYYKNGNISWITSKATNDDLVYESEQLVTDVALRECRLKLNPIGTLIVALYGQGKTRGQVSELMIETTTNQALATILVDDKQAINRYLKYFLKKSYLDLREKASGGTQPNLNLTIIKNTELPFPPKKIQGNVVAYLDEISEKIEKVKSIQKEKMENLKALKASILDKAFKGKL
ncbi:hypothetical protein CRU96_08305 [Malaciobacter halophilus]|nr:restriction endonuclease subunit S [Malaciobacter halophilus]RYA23357.1 hypothetical protein CRU96_08305 [Malaciobacter halophilus]